MSIGESHQRALEEARQYVRKLSIVTLGDKPDKDKDKEAEDKDIRPDQVTSCLQGPLSAHCTVHCTDEPWETCLKGGVFDWLTNLIYIQQYQFLHSTLSVLLTVCVAVALYDITNNYKEVFSCYKEG